MDEQTDVAIVGASIAGCAAARFLAQRGARVTLIEKRPDPEAYKVVCTHYIQPSAMSAIRRLGLDGPLEEAGAAPAKIDVWTRYGWACWQDDAYHGYNVRRSVLDPLLRRLTIETPGVTYLGGRTAVGLVEDGDRIRGVRVRATGGAEGTIAARLVVAADGRDSTVARMARVPARKRPHGRFVYFAYFKDFELTHGDRSQMWLLDPDLAYLFPSDDGTTCVAAFLSHAQRDAVRTDPDSHIRELYARLADAPNPWSGRRVSEWIGKLVLDNQRRPASARGMAFVGDAAQASDPVAGVGCGFAFQSADWLADEVSGALSEGDEALDRALRRYRAQHRRRLAGHHWVLSDFSTGRKMRPAEKLVLSAAVRDEGFAARLEQFASRDVTPARFVPGALARAGAVHLRHAVSARPDPTPPAQPGS